MYEVEIKIEINQAIKDRLTSVLLNRGFIDEGISLQKDYYVKATESLNNAFDIERYRQDGNQFFYTKKAWEVEDGKPVRREDEHEVSQDEFEKVTSQYPEALQIIKNRQRFVGSFEGVEITFSIDSVIFDHSSNIRYFIEPEIIVEDKTKVSYIKELLLRFAAELLGIGIAEIIEAPGMFAMAYKKL